MVSPRIHALTDPALIDDLASVELEEVRQRRARCQEAELALSYVRRMVQGRLDIVLAEQARRQGGEQSDLAQLVQQLPEILAEHRPTGSFARPDAMTALDDADQLIPDLSEEIDQIVGPDELASLPDMDERQLVEVADRLEDAERRISSDRQALHARLDQFQAEIVRRYRTGEATVEGLLEPK